jgi:hypothetical protein
MQMVDWFSGAEYPSDAPDCACFLLTNIGMRLNDAASDEQRQTLWPFIWLLIGSKDDEALSRRAEYVVREAAHRVVAPTLPKRQAAALLRARTMVEIHKAALAARADRGARLIAYATQPDQHLNVTAAMVADVLCDFEKKQWETLRDIFHEAILLGDHGEPDPVGYEQRAQQLEALCDRHW